MKITADTNLLVRLLTEDDEAQNQLAARVLNEADVVALAYPMLCELVWVLRRGYRLSGDEVAVRLRSLIDLPNATCDRVAVEAGIAILEAGGDFADGVIADEGRRLGADTFVSFDKTAVRLLSARQTAAKLLA